MIKRFFGARKSDLAERCKRYLETGPPEHMTDYVPESLTEILITHGAEGKALDPELLEVASIILLESGDFAEISDSAIRDYMIQGAALVKEVLDGQ